MFSSRELRSLRLPYVWNLHGKKIQNERGEWVENERRVGRMLEGGPMVDCGVHQIDLARWWMGREVARWQSTGAWIENYQAPDHLYLHLDLESGAHTCVEMSFSFGHTALEPRPYFAYFLIGTDGVLSFEGETGVF